MYPQLNQMLDMRDGEGHYRQRMETITEVFVRLTKRLKRELVERLDGGYHGAMFGRFRPAHRLY